MHDACRRGAAVRTLLPARACVINSRPGHALRRSPSDSQVANEYAYQLEQQGSVGAAAAAAARAGPGGLPTGGTRSAEADAEAGVMSYVMRRCGGAREPLPSWWPPELRALIAACWAPDPAERPGFSKVRLPRDPSARGSVPTSPVHEAREDVAVVVLCLGRRAAACEHDCGERCR